MAARARHSSRSDQVTDSSGGTFLMPAAPSSSGGPFSVNPGVRARQHRQGFASTVSTLTRRCVIATSFLIFQFLHRPLAKGPHHPLVKEQKAATMTLPTAL